MNSFGITGRIRDSKNREYVPMHACVLLVFLQSGILVGIQRIGGKVDDVRDDDYSVKWVRVQFIKN